MIITLAQEIVTDKAPTLTTVDDDENSDEG
jgi:hypothetical protein